MARGVWGLWWGLGLGVPFVQLPATSVEDSGWIAFACWLLAAGWLSLWTPQRRLVPTGWLALVLAACLIHPLSMSWPALTQSAWVDEWGLVARLSANGVFAVCLAWGTASVVTHSPRMDRSLPWALAAVLAVNLVGMLLQQRGGWDAAGHYLASPGSFTRWVWNQPADLGGFFSSGTVWTAVAALSLPVLCDQPGWRPWLVLPAIGAVLLMPRTAVLVALLVWVAWRSVGWLRVVLVLAGTGLWVSRVESWPSIALSLAPRLETWPVILQAILQHPLGIGWHPMAYHEIVRTAPHPIMGHPSSAVLAWTLAGGWAVGLTMLGAIGGSLRWLRRDGLSGAMVVGLVLLLISRTPAQAQVGAWLWAMACGWWIQRTEESHARMA